MRKNLTTRNYYRQKWRTCFSTLYIRCPQFLHVPLAFNTTASLGTCLET